MPTTLDEFVDAAVALKKANAEPRTSPASGSPARTGATASRSSGTPAATSPSQDGDEWVGAARSDRVDRRPRDRAEAVRARPPARQGRQRGRPVDAVLRRRGRHDVGAGWVTRPDRRRRRRLPGHGRKQSASSRCPAPTATRPRCCSVARHRHPGQVAEPGPGPEGRRADAQRRVPDDPGRAGLIPAKTCSPRCWVTTSSPRRPSPRRQRQAHPGRAELGRRRGRRGSSRTCSSRSPRAATSPSCAARPTSRSTDSSTADADQQRHGRPGRSIRRPGRAMPGPGPVPDDGSHEDERGDAWPATPSTIAGAARPRPRRTPCCPTASWSRPLVALVVALGYPLVRQVVLSFQEFGLAQQFGQPPEWVGLENYRELLTDPYLWTVAAPVARSSASSTPSSRWCSASAIALLMRQMAEAGPAAGAERAAARLGDAGARRARPSGSGSSTPQYGVVNWLLTQARRSTRRATPGCSSRCPSSSSPPSSWCG